MGDRVVLSFPVQDEKAQEAEVRPVERWKASAGSGMNLDDFSGFLFFLGGGGG